MLSKHGCVCCALPNSSIAWPIVNACQHKVDFATHARCDAMASPSLQSSHATQGRASVSSTRAPVLQRPLKSMCPNARRVTTPQEEEKRAKHAELCRNCIPRSTCSGAIRPCHSLGAHALMKTLLIVRRISNYTPCFFRAESFPGCCVDCVH